MKPHTRFSRISLLSITLLFAIGTLSVLAGRTLVTNQGRGRSFFQKLVDKPVASRVGWITRRLSGKATPSAASRMAITVTNANDSGAGSLRQAIADAASGDTITFASGISLVSLTSGELVINKNLTIQGPGANLLTVQNTAAASATSRVFNISSGTVTLAGMTISGGNLTGGATGGGIFNSGNLTLRDSVVTGNAVSGGNAGGIYNNGSSVSILNSTISNNSITGTFFLGGGIFHDAGTMTLTNSTVSGNTNQGSISSIGGGIRAHGALILTNCTITNNTSSGGSPFGGGVSLGNGGTLTTRNTIFSNNNAPRGPDIFGTINSLGYNLISNTADTIIGGITTGNVLGQPAQLAALLNNGGPTPTHALMSGSPAINAGDSCVMAAGGCGTNDPMTAFTTDQRGAGFPRQSGVQVDIGAFESQFPCPSISVTNPATSMGIAGVAFSQTFTQTGGIGAITFSTTSTLPTGLTLSSAGVLSGAPTQTGTFPMVVRATDITTCFGDSATYSLVISCQNNPVVMTNADSGAGSLREAIAIACPGSTITFANTVVSPIVLTSGELVINKNLTIQGPGASQLTISGNNASRVFNIGSGTNVAISGLTITMGTAASGGGILNSGTLMVTNSTLTGNTATQVGGAILNAGTLLTVDSCTFTGNSANKGGALASQSGSANIHYCRIVGNTSGTGSGLFVDTTSGPVDATLNWWGCNTGPSGAACDKLATTASVPVDPRLSVRVTATPSDIYQGESSQISAGFTFNSSGNPVSPTNLGALIGLPVSFSLDNVLSLPAVFTNTQTTIQANGLATTTVTPNLVTSLPKASGYLGPIQVVAQIDNQATSGGANLNCIQTPQVMTNADSGAGSLREAMTRVCPGGTITFASGISTVTLTTAELFLNKNVTIDGGSGVTITRSTVGGTPDFRIFSIASDTTVTLNRLTMTNGKISTLNPAGGGILNGGTVNLINCTVSSCAAAAADAGPDFSTGQGGGIFNGNSGTVNMINSTLSGNSVSGNVSAGGGIFSGNNVTLINSTISGNSASGNSRGGGIFINFGSVSARNTIIAGNATTPGNSPDVFGAFTSQGHNLIGKTDGSSGWVGTDLTGTIAAPLAALLAPLGNYGGPTQTHRPLPGSPAIDAGDDCVADVAHCGDANVPQLTTDQRGAGFNRKVGTHVDIGAVEVNYMLAASSGSGQSATINTAFANPLLVTLTESGQPASGLAITFAANPAGNGASAMLGIPNPATTDSNGQASVNATANNFAGTYTVTASAVSNLMATFNLSNTCSTFTVGTPANSGALGGNYNSSVAATPAVSAPLNYRYSLANGTTLPAGLTLDANTGAITGIPTTPGNISFDIKVELFDSNTPTGCAVTATRSISILCVTNPVVTNSADSGTGSLREAIAIACPGSTITFSGVSTVSLMSGRLAINKNLTIDGGSGVTVTRSSGTFQIFNLTAGTVAFKNLTITNGNAGAGNGGGIVTASGVDLTCSNCTLSGNTATSGGAISSNGTLTLSSCTISGNTATNGSNGIAANGNTSISNCTFNNNTGSAQTIQQNSIGKTLAITNSTFTGNTNANGALGVSFATATLLNCTFSGNTGLRTCLVDNGGVLNLKNTIVAGSGTQLGAFSGGTITSKGNNLISDNSLPLPLASDLVNTSPLLGSLGSYGGPTQTIRPLPGSPAIDAGDDCVADVAHCGDASFPQLTTDQRGTGFNRKVGTHVDIGAVEVSYALAVSGGSGQSAAVNTAFANPLLVTLTESGAAASGVPLTFTAQPAGNGASATLGSPNPATTNSNGQASVTATANGIGGSYTVTASATGGNPSASFSLTNNAPPMFTACPTNQSVNAAAGQCTAAVAFNPTASGLPAPTITCKIGATTITSPYNFPVGTSNVTCTATNGNAPDATCSFMVTVNDTQVPTITACPANITNQSAGANCAAVVNFTPPSGSDNCGTPTVTCTPASGSSFPLGTTTVSCVAKDAANNMSAACTFTVQVVDKTAPTLGACPANVTTNISPGLCTAQVTYASPTVSDNCTGATVTCAPASGSSFAIGTTTVTCTPKDAANNIGATCSFTVTVKDNQAPTIACPASLSLGTTGASAIATWNPPTVNDGCSSVNTPVCTPASGSSFNVGVTTVTCTATDGANNSASCSFTVTVNRVSGSAFDPLACTGPGNTVQATLVISNNGNVNQTVANTTTFTNLKGVPGSCTLTPNVGTCTVTGGNLTYNATLTLGQTVTISYLTQVSDLAPTGAQVCTNNSVTFNGGNPLAFSVCDVVDCPAAGPGNLIPAAAEASDQKAGSVLIYNVYTSGATSGNTQNTRINITNTHTALPAYVHLFFIAENCAVADSYICLTANQTSSFLANDLDPGTTGYIVAVATNNIGCPINFNYLIGDEYVKFTSGHAANLAAQAFSALPGGLPPCDGNTVITSLNFDGVSYNRVPAALAVDSIASRADGNDTMLILNRVGGNLGLGTSTLGTLFGILYNDAENAVSFSVNGSCQLRGSLSNNFPRTTPRFDGFIAAGRTGWMKIYEQTGAIGIAGAVINFNPNATATVGAFNQGHNLHGLTLNSSASYILPIFPPNC